jgi:hypothetical protein
MIVYRRGLKKEDILSLEPDEELIYYKDNNIAFTILEVDNNYVLRKKKIFNNQLVDERFVKTAEQIIKVVE